MTYEVVLNGVPKSLVINNSVSWKVSLSDFPATGWTLSYALVNSDGQIIITASASGTDHLVEISPATSGAYTAGEYTYQSFVEKADSSERYQVGSGQIEILADYADASSGLDARSWVKVTLDAIKSVVTGKVAHDRASYAIHGRSLASYSWEEILDLYAKFKGMYAAEQRVTRKRSSSVKVAFK